MTSPALPFRDSIRFYDRDADLVSLLVEHTGPALREGRDAFVIASAPVVHALSMRLHRDYLRATATGLLTLIDARSTLDQILVEGWPDAAAFERHLGALVRMPGSPGTKALAYGEMISLLWDEGRQDAALRLESIWAGVASQGDFATLCAYPSRLFNCVGEEAAAQPAVREEREAMAA